MTGMIDTSRTSAQESFARLMNHIASLYCMSGSSSISTQEAHELTLSVSYVIGILGAAPEEAARVLAADDPIALWHTGLTALDDRVERALRQRNELLAIMPPLHNVALRDTLASLSELRSRYDTRFAAHVVPCDIDYQLSKPIDPHLPGIDYIEAWLAQLMREARWIARFDTESCIAVLEMVCPDYRGLHVNLYDLLHPYEDELRQASKT